MKYDVDINAKDIAQLINADAIADFFARFGYNTNVRTEQTPHNLGISAAGTIRPINRIELIASQEGLFQVYLFELSSVTINHTRALVRSFKNLRGYFLLVLTSNYERIDFVLVERSIPVSTDSDKTISLRQVSVRPRTLTIDRHKPVIVGIRVIKRFTYTAADQWAQYDKMLSAYTIAEWSEEYFNNRALFSDYFLVERLKRFPEWKEDPKPVFTAMNELYRDALARFGNEPEQTLRTNLIEPVLKMLGFAFQKGKKAGSDAPEPDYLLRSPHRDSTLLAHLLVYPWGRSLDGKDDQRDKESSEENPGAVVVSLLERGETPWATVTNGKIWRLYSARTHSRATNYYEIDLEEILAETKSQTLDPAAAFRYFWLFFRREAFESTEVVREGEKQLGTFLDRLLDESQDFAKELGEQLKERVFIDIFPHLAKGFLEHIRTSSETDTQTTQDLLDTIFQGTLTLLYRLLFLLYAEARDLLPVRETRGYFEISLEQLKKEVAAIAGDILDEVQANIKRRFKNDSYTLYDRLDQLFSIIDLGKSSMNVPVYNGGLFISNPAPDDTSAEAVSAQFLKTTKISDRYLAFAIDLLARDIDTKRHSLVLIDYKSLGVRQLGSIYEGLLEFKLKIADRKLGTVIKKGREVYVPYTKLNERQKTKAEKNETVIPKGALYLENDKSERKATGSYYTPDHIVKYIVAKAVGPVLDKQFDGLRPEFRKAQQERDAFFKRQASFRQQGIKPGPDSKADLIGTGLVDDLFSARVLDPAMGSGHFLVEAVDYTTDRIINFLNAFPWNPVTAALKRTRESILQEMDKQEVDIDPKRLTDVNLLKRHVLKRCMYGVDINPMAVELAKVSLWLDCFTLGAPLSFLDHHLRCGNSLIGVTVDEVRNSLEWKELTSGSLFGSKFTGLLLATDLMRRVGKLSDVTSSQVRESRQEYKKATDALAPFKRILDVYTSQWFGNEEKKKRKRKHKEPVDPPVIDFLKSTDAEQYINATTDRETEKALKTLSKAYRSMAEIALEAAEDKRFFHWELEFPEVFYGPRPGTRQAIEQLEGAGFDAVIGNPPYDVLSELELGYDISQEKNFYELYETYKPAIVGKKNLYKLFICRGAFTMALDGYFSFIVPMTLLGDQQSSGVRENLLKRTTIKAIEAFPQKDNTHNRVFPDAKLSTTIFVTQNCISDEKFIVRTHPGRIILESSPILFIKPSEMIKIDNVNYVIPSCTQKDWDIAVRIIERDNVKKIKNYCVAYQGEVNETTDGKKGFISTYEKDGPKIQRGSNICLYVIRTASQGKDIFLRKEKYLKSKPGSEKVWHHTQKRIGWQESSPQNNFRRIICATIPKGMFCNHLINYIPQNASDIPLNFLLALLNGKLFDWYFRLTSTNAHVSHYQIYNLPAPSFIQTETSPEWQNIFENSQLIELRHLLCQSIIIPGEMPEFVVQALSKMSEKIQSIEAKRVLKGRSERSHLAPESQPIQDVIDAVLFKCYGLSEEEAIYIERRLEEML